MKGSKSLWLRFLEYFKNIFYITFMLMISGSPGSSWQLKAEGWPQKGRHFYVSLHKKGKLRISPFSDERIDINCEEKAIFMFLTVTQSLRNLHYRYRPACKLFSFQLATNLRSKKALITSLN